jgi:hypothetical protein
MTTELCLLITAVLAFINGQAAWAFLAVTMALKVAGVI